MKFGHTIEDSKKKYPELEDKDLEELENWARDRDLPHIPKEQLALFLHSCYFNKEASIQCMNVYYRLRATVPEFFGNRDPKLDYLQHSLKVLQFATLPVTDPNGHRIIAHRLADMRPSQYMLNDGIKLLIMSVDASLYMDGCYPGYVFLFDMRGVRLGHLTRLSMTSIRRFFEYLQEGLPVRLKGIHVLNAVWFMDKILSLIRPFMKRELFDMLHLYTGEVSDIYEHIPPKCLPQDYGGELDCMEVLHEAHSKKLYELRDYFLEEESLFRSYESKSGKSSTTSNSSPPEEIPQDILADLNIGDGNNDM